MARILAYTSPARGHLFPLTPILDELHRRGHEIAVRTLASEVEVMRTRGFSASPIDPQIEALAIEDWRSHNPRRALKIAMEGFCSRAPYEAADLRRALDDELPEAVIVDINSWGALATAESWAGPWASFCPYPAALQSPDVPPFGPGLAPARGPFGRVRDRLLRPLAVGALEKVVLPKVNSVRGEVGLPPLHGADDLFTRPPLLLYMTAEPFEYHRRNLPASIVMVGPCAWEPPSAPPEWLAAVRDPIVLVTTSSEFQDDGRLVRVALEALAHEPVHVVGTLPAGDPGGYNVPDNAHVECFLSHGPLLDRAVCAVTHGGMGATQKALAHGVPVCAVPFGRDQFEVARRVEIAGAGTRLPAKRLNPNRLRTGVRQAMACTAGARRVAAGFDAAGGAGTAASAVENRLLGSHHNGVRVGAVRD